MHGATDTARANKSRIPADFPHIFLVLRAHFCGSQRSRRRLQSSYFVRFPRKQYSGACLLQLFLGRRSFTGRLNLPHPPAIALVRRRAEYFRSPNPLPTPAPNRKIRVVLIVVVGESWECGRGGGAVKLWIPVRFALLCSRSTKILPLS